MKDAYLDHSHIAKTFLHFLNRLLQCGVGILLNRIHPSASLILSRNYHSLSADLLFSSKNKLSSRTGNQFKGVGLINMSFLYFKIISKSLHCKQLHRHRWFLEVLLPMTHWFIDLYYIFIFVVENQVVFHNYIHRFHFLSIFRKLKVSFPRMKSWYQNVHLGINNRCHRTAKLAFGGRTKWHIKIHCISNAI